MRPGDKLPPKSVKRGKIVPRATVRVNVYEVISRAVEDGVVMGWRHGWKHLDGEPCEKVDTIQNAIVSDVMNALIEVLEFDDEDL